MTTITQMVRVEQRGSLWVVLVPSPLGRWIVQGEWATKQEAEADATMFRRMAA